MFVKRLKSQHEIYNFMGIMAKGRADVGRFIQTVPEAGPVGAIYIHVPFCRKLCNFCSMQRVLSAPDEDYPELLAKEIEHYGNSGYIKNSMFSSVYFGGGTPTALSSGALKNIFEALKRNFNISADAEISVESTVTELTEEKEDTLKECGVNRLSIGVQTFSNAGRKTLGRLGTGKQAYEKLLELEKKGFKNVNIDIIYNYPGQTIGDVREDLKKIFSLRLGGFSFYSLINMSTSNVLTDDRLDMELFEQIYDGALHEGFSVLELTKLAVYDEYRYIRLNHSAADTLGLGAGAGGSLSNIVYRNPLSLSGYRNYIENIRQKGTAGMLLKDEYKTVSRLKGDMQQCRIPVGKYGNIINDNARRLLSGLVSEGYILEGEDCYDMTKKGIYWGNNIADAVVKSLVCPEWPSIPGSRMLS